MLPRLIFLFLCAPLALSAATMEQEYQQVRTIALRDSRVREAYDDADKRLEEKMLRIDPALAGYLRHRPAGGFAKPAPTPEPALAKKAAPANRNEPEPKTAASHFERSHVVLKGETLSSIATIFGVTVESLKTTNHIADERKLAVGQKLEIPDRTR